MSGIIEKPRFVDVQQKVLEGDAAMEMRAEIGMLLGTQPFAVLATQGTDITDASLVTFAAGENLKNIVFATPVQTGKYDFISMNENVSLLVDDRTLHQDNINQISALTVIGKATILSDEKEVQKWGNLLTKRHPTLSEFVSAPSTAIIRVVVNRYLYVKHFQDLRVWDPK